MAHQGTALECTHADQADHAIGELEHLQRLGEGDQALDVVGDDLLGADREVDREVVVVEQLGVVDVVGRAQACDPRRQVVERLGDAAGAQVGLVGLGDRDQQVSVVGAGLAQHARRCGVAAHGADLETLAHRGQVFLAGIDQRDVVRFGNQVLGHRRADLARTQNDDLHLCSRLCSGRRFYARRAGRETPTLRRNIRPLRGGARPAGRAA